MRLEPELTVMSLSPEVLDTVIVLLPVGCADSFTLNVLVPPSGMLIMSLSVRIATGLTAKFARMVAAAVIVTVVAAEFALPKLALPLPLVTVQFTK